MHALTDVNFSRMMDPCGLREVLKSISPGSSFSAEACASLADFCRHLAAYYLGLPCLEKAVDLFTWTDMTMADCVFAYPADERAQLGSILPAEYTPRFVAALLFATGRHLEAILFLDYFNDMRSQLSLRLVVDSLNGTSLFDEHCRSELIDGLLEWLAGMGKVGNRAEEEEILIRERIDSHIAILLRLDASVGSNHLRVLELKVLANIDELLAQHDNGLIASSLLPPIYAATALGANCSSEEATAFNLIHHLLHVLFSSLSRTNRLGPAGNWLMTLIVKRRLTSPARRNGFQNGFDEPHGGVEWETMEPDWADKQLMQHILAIVLEVDNLQCWRYVTPATGEKVQNDGQWLAEWVENAAESELQYATTFICYLLEKYPQENNLPPFNTASRGRWRAWAFSNMPSSANHTSGRDRFPLLMFDAARKVRLSGSEWERLLFVQSLYFPPLADPTLIQIHVGFEPSDVCRTALANVDEKWEAGKESEELYGGAQPRKRIRPRHPDRLLQEIRESIQRLSDFTNDAEKPPNSSGGIARTRHFSGMPESTGSQLKEILRRHELRTMEEEIRGEELYIRQLDDDHLCLELDSPLRGPGVLCHSAGLNAVHSPRYGIAEEPTAGDDPAGANAGASRSETSEVDRNEGSLREEINHISQRLAEIKRYLGEESPRSKNKDSDRSGISSTEKSDEVAALESADERENWDQSSPSKMSISDEKLGGRDLSVIVEEKAEQLEEGGSNEEETTSSTPPTATDKSRPTEADDMRLDLSKLDSSPREPKRKSKRPNSSDHVIAEVNGGREEWIELEVHPRTPQSKFNDEKQPKRKSQKKKLSPYPRWLRLLPRADGHSSFRLLQLPKDCADAGAYKHDVKSARERSRSSLACDNLMDEAETRDSGFLEHPEEEGCPAVFSYELSRDQIDRLINLRQR